MLCAKAAFLSPWDDHNASCEGTSGIFGTPEHWTCIVFTIGSRGKGIYIDWSKIPDHKSWHICAQPNNNNNNNIAENIETQSKYLVTVVSRFTLRALFLGPLLPTGVTVLMILLQKWSNMRFWLTHERFYTNNEKASGFIGSWNIFCLNFFR